MFIAARPVGYGSFPIRDGIGCIILAIKNRGIGNGRIESGCSKKDIPGRLDLHAVQRKEPLQPQQAASKVPQMQLTQAAPEEKGQEEKCVTLASSKFFFVLA